MALDPRRSGRKHNRWCARRCRTPPRSYEYQRAARGGGPQPTRARRSDGGGGSSSSSKGAGSCAPLR
eukprot:scaffold5320_cov350-Prasinococcus_capsulatus_cf.AAC.6